MEVQKALAELREKRERKFKQTIDLIINLKGLDLRRDSVNIVINVPHKTREKKVCGFLNAKSPLIKTITKQEFAKYKEKNALKNLVKQFDFFIAEAPLMPQVATNFGKILGPAGKMPSPQLGLLTQVNDETINAQLEKISKAVKIRLKEASIKLSIGNEAMTDQEIIDNFNAIVKGVVNALPKNKDNIKNVLLKLTMTKPLKINI